MWGSSPRSQYSRTVRTAGVPGAFETLFTVSVYSLLPSTLPPTVYGCKVASRLPFALPSTVTRGAQHVSTDSRRQSKRRKVTLATSQRRTASGTNAAPCARADEIRPSHCRVVGPLH